MSNSDHTNILISVVTPVYNGATFVSKAYECLCRQTFKDWEWVVVDDGSTDDTLSLLRRIADADKRVICYTQKASGSAKQPRDHAVAEAHGRFVLPLDIDDRLADNYIDTMLERQKQTDADIVYPHMVFVDLNTGHVSEELPAADFDSTQVYGGSDLVRETMPAWRIGCNGGLYRRDVWVNSSWPEKNGPIWMNSDEVDERLYLLEARRVAFAQTDYFYQNHAESITTHISPKLFHPLKTGLQLLDLCEETFGLDSEEYHRANTKLFYNWRSMMALYVSHYAELENAEGEIVQNLRTAFCRINPALLTRGERFRFLHLCSFPLLMALFCLKYSPQQLVRKAFQHFMPKVYRWTVVRRTTERQTRSELSGSYRPTNDIAACQPHVVSMFCGNTASGGLVDRLRGAVSVFLSCQEAGRDFKLHFTHPFLLTDYLTPADYDWQIAPGEVSFSQQQTAVVVSDSQAGTRWEECLQQRYIALKIRQNANRQVHCYTNAAYCYRQGFAEAFCRLFQPSPLLQKHIDEVKAAIGGSYITVSARFCNLLDDFNEEVYSEPLSTAARERLLTACLKKIEVLHSRQPKLRLVACSDSTTFLQRVAYDMGAFVVPGVVSHIGNDGAHDYDYYEKTFLDFFTIAGASRAYLLLGPGMYGSGFPYAAALSSGIPYEVVQV